MILHNQVLNSVKTLSLIILIPILFIENNLLHAQNQNFSFKFGIESGVGLFKPDDINQLVENWLESQYGFVYNNSDIKIRPDLIFNSYLAYSLHEYVELRLDFEYVYSPAVFDSFISDDLNIAIMSYSPGVSVNLKWEIFQFGGGIFRYYSLIEWEDKIFNYIDTWQGDNYGFHLNAGISLQMSSHLGFSSTILYRSITIKELKDKNNRVLIHIPENRNFTLDISGFEFRMGLFYTF